MDHVPARGAITMPTPIILTLPYPATRNTSQDRHWAVRHKRVRAYYERCDYALLMQRVPVPDVPHPAVWAAAGVYPRGYSDEDGLMARLKPLIDWCVRAGFVEDDRPRSWRWESVPGQHVQRREAAHVVLSLTPRRQYHDPYPVRPL